MHKSLSPCRSVKVRTNFDAIFGAVDRLGTDTQEMFDNGHVEAREMKDLSDRGIGQQPLQVWCRVTFLIELDEVAGTVAGR